MITWDEQKNIKLKLERNLSFEETAELILNGHIVDVIEHPRRKNQNIFVVEINNYMHAVPFIIDRNNTIILKTIFPSRTLNKKYRGEK